MNFFFERLKDILPAWWSTSGRLIYSITGGGLVAYLAKTLGLSLTYATSIALATVPILAFWLWWESRLPKGDLNKANIAIAIATETELERQLVRRDLVEAFDAQVQHDPNARLNTFLIPPHHCIRS